jgi:hypothetical protein
MSDDNSAATKQQIQDIGRLLIEVLQGAVNEGVTEITVGDFMRTFAYDEEEASKWDDVILVFIKDENDDAPKKPTFHILH